SLSETMMSRRSSASFSSPNRLINAAAMKEGLSGSMRPSAKIAACRTNLSASSMSGKSPVVASLASAPTLAMASAAAARAAASVVLVQVLETMLVAEFAERRGGEGPLAGRRVVLQRIDPGFGFLAVVNGIVIGPGEDGVSRQQNCEASETKGEKHGELRSWRA